MSLLLYTSCRKLIYMERNEQNIPCLASRQLMGKLDELQSSNAHGLKSATPFLCKSPLFLKQRVAYENITVSNLECDMHGIIRAKGFVAIRTFSHPVVLSFFNTLKAKDMPACLDRSVFKVYTANRTNRQCLRFHVSEDFYLN